VEPERASCDQPDVCVDLLDPGGGEAVLDRGEDPVALLGDRAGELDECRQTCSTRPRQPAVEQATRRGGRELVDLAQLLLEQVRAVHAGVGLLDRGELRRLAVGEVLRVLPDREPGAFELAGELDVALAARLVPDLATNVVERLGGEHHDVERVDASDGVGNAFGDRTRDPRGHVGRHQFDLFAAFFAERVKERQHRLAVPAGCGPDQAAGVMVHDDGQVPLALAVADLVDPDPSEPVEQIDLTHRFGGDPFDRCANRSPRDAHQFGDRGL